MQSRILRIGITLYTSSGHQNVKHKTKKNQKNRKATIQGIIKCLPNTV